MSAELPSRVVELGPAGVSPNPWAPHHPTFSAVADGLSVLVVHLEPCAIRALRQGALAIGETDHPLTAAVSAWVRQEAGHQRAHRRHRDDLVAVCPGLTRVEPVAAALSRWVDRRSLRVRTSAVVGFETLAYAIARWVAPRIGTLLVEADPRVATIFLWHLAEEVEHKSVAHDVHERLGGRWPSRLAGGLAVSVVVGILTLVAALVRLRSQRRLRYPSTWWRLLRDATAFALVALTTVAASSLPGHHPDQLSDPSWYARFLVGADLAGRVDTWRPPAAPTVTQTRPSRASKGPVTS